jgi:hypothetical protein
MRTRKFQSHLGSILPLEVKEYADAEALFQSHLGSILPQLTGGLCKREFGFNPTLVRFCQGAAR